MASSRNILLATLGLILAATVAEAASRAQLRFLSFVIRDQAPTVEEAKAFRSGEKSLEGLVQQWLRDPGHTARIKRYFQDMFGVADDVNVLMNPFMLKKAKDTDYYYRWWDDKKVCPNQDYTDVEAWWLEPGETVKVCRTEATDSLEFEATDGTRHPCTADQIRMQACGCGPKLIGCLPEDLQDQLLADVRDEFPSRAARSYELDQSWLDVFAGDTFYGTRLLYWKYLHTTKMARGGVLPTAAEMAALAAIPMGAWQEAPFPEGAERAGLVTSPGFLLQRNNYRVRIRALAEKLLCQGIGPALNTGGIATFLNPDFKAVDLGHANQTDCSRCHYPMDNLGSLLFGWNTQGEWDPLKSPSTIGHAFAQDGDGPRFLARAFVERGPGFVDCMARTAWEDFSGTKWDDLVETERQALLALAARGPKPLIQTMLTSTLLASLGIESEQAASDAPNAVPWLSVSPLVKDACGGASCHSNGSFNTTYVDNERNFRTNATRIAGRITNDKGQQMPPKAAARQLTADERALLLKFLGK